MGAWVRGCVGAWVRACVGAWVRGCVGAWVRGCVDAWASGPLGADPLAQGRVVGKLRGHPGVAVLLHEPPQRRETLVPHAWLHHHPLEPDALQLLHAHRTDTV